MAYEIKFSIPYLPPVGMNQRGHWSKAHKETRLVDSLVSAAVCGRKPEKPLQKRKLFLQRHSSVCPDFDGLVHSFKNVVDALVTCGILVNDRMENTGAWQVEWRKAPPKGGFIVVHVVEHAEE